MKALVAVLGFTLSLLAASISDAQSQLQIKPNQTPGTPVLEIPVVINPGQPPLDPTFAGEWCGTMRSVPGGTGSSTPENEKFLRDLQSRMQTYDVCQTFERKGSSIVVDDRLALGDTGVSLIKAGETAHVVTEYAEAIGPREIAVTVVIELAFREKRGTLAMSTRLKLTDADQVEATRTDRFQVTDLNYSSVLNSTIIESGNLHKARPGEFEAWLAENYYKVGGSNLEVPGAR